MSTKNILFLLVCVFNYFYTIQAMAPVPHIVVYTEDVGRSGSLSGGLGIVGAQHNRRVSINARPDDALLRSQMYTEQRNAAFAYAGAFPLFLGGLGSMLLFLSGNDALPSEVLLSVGAGGMALGALLCAVGVRFEKKDSVTQLIHKSPNRLLRLSKRLTRAMRLAPISEENQPPPIYREAYQA